MVSFCVCTRASQQAQISAIMSCKAQHGHRGRAKTAGGHGKALLAQPYPLRRAALLCSFSTSRPALATTASSCGGEQRYLRFPGEVTQSTRANYRLDAAALGDSSPDRRV